tara:strand:+ start:20820 stop:21002 length:183 start_codon:yes stop_codon:yes gene_type:complete
MRSGSRITVTQAVGSGPPLGSSRRGVDAGWQGQPTMVGVDVTTARELLVAIWLGELPATD